MWFRYVNQSLYGYIYVYHTYMWCFSITPIERNAYVYNIILTVTPVTRTHTVTPRNKSISTLVAPNMHTSHEINRLHLIRASAGYMSMLRLITCRPSVDDTIQLHTLVNLYICHELFWYHHTSIMLAGSQIISVTSLTPQLFSYISTDPHHASNNTHLIRIEV